MKTKFTTDYVRGRSDDDGASYTYPWGAVGVEPYPQALGAEAMTPQVNWTCPSTVGEASVAAGAFAPLRQARIENIQNPNAQWHTSKLNFKEWEWLS